jgi:LytS/YehU family sensor histidine kinase
VLPLLREGLDVRSSKHAARVLQGLTKIAKVAPKLSREIRALAERFEEHHRPGIRKAAKSLLRATGAEVA